MITVGIALAHAFGTNRDFQPTLLYIGALIVDSILFEAVAKCEFCGTQHTDNKNDQGVPECPSCRNARREREYEQNKKNQIVDAERFDQ